MKAAAPWKSRRAARSDCALRDSSHMLRPWIHFRKIAAESAGTARSLRCATFASSVARRSSCGLHFSRVEHRALSVPVLLLLSDSRQSLSERRLASLENENATLRAELARDKSA